MELATQLNAAIAFVYVVNDSFVALGTGATYGSPTTVLNEMQAEGIAVINKVARNMKTEPQKFIGVGKPAEEILNRAKQWKTSLIVMGTRGRTGLKHLLMGSVAEHVMRHSKCPVLVVPKT